MTLLLMLGIMKCLTPLHVAALKGNYRVVVALIKEFHCDFDARDYHGRSFLHLAALKNKPNVIRHAGTFVSSILVDDDGDTPLHICSELGHSECVKALLQLNASILVRNNAGATPMTAATKEVRTLLEEHKKINQEQIKANADAIEAFTKNHRSEERITRIFVVGNPGVGKSSLIETLKRERFYDYLRKVSEASVQRHTAGIIPSVHVSKHYGRVLFYDFAGDPEYYSSHAAILENLTASKKGDHIFIIVVDLTEENAKILSQLHYWAAFVQYQKFSKPPFFLVVGSHFDLITKEQTIQDRKEALQKFCTYMEKRCGSVDYVFLDCCQPNSRNINELQKSIVSMIADSPSYKLSVQASLLLGVLEKDFGNVISCSGKDIMSHVDDTNLPLPRKVRSIYLILYQLHEFCFLLMIKDKKSCSYQIILNTTLLTNKVHKALFSRAAVKKMNECIEQEGSSLPPFNIGIIPETALRSFFNLPNSVTKESLIQLQYCQEISHRHIHIFSNAPRCSPDDNEAYLFFPALCSTSKRDVPWQTPKGFNYSIGWVARCSEMRDYFPPRFLHVLLLRLVNECALPVHHQKEDGHHGHQRRCNMWKTGVRWLMEEDVECIVELLNGSKQVVVIARSEEELMENCIRVFNKIVACVVDLKSKFCYSIRPRYFLLGHTEDDAYLSEDNLFALEDVERVLLEGRMAVLSVNGNGRLKRDRLMCLRSLTLWNTLFPINIVSVLDHLKSVVSNLSVLGYRLGLSYSDVEVIKASYGNDINRMKGGIVSSWMKFSSDPACWCHLVEALYDIDHGVIAEEIEKKYGVHVPAQRTLLNLEKRLLKPDEEFLEQFSSVVESKWPSLAALLSLTSSEIEDVKKYELSLSEQALALQTLRKWVSRDDATYGHLFQKLKTISLFHYTNEPFDLSDSA